MSTPVSRARCLRGALIGACSAVITVAAHALGGGHTPAGAGLVMTFLACAITGAAASGVELEDRRLRVVMVISALVVGQLLGHMTLVISGGGHHGAAGIAVAPTMLAAHGAAAVVLGLAISVVEYLYVVCTSVLCWLRLFAAAATTRPAQRAPRRVKTGLVVESVMLRSGLGMRAPPARFATA